MTRERPKYAAICKYCQISYSNTIVLLAEAMMSIFEFETLKRRSRVIKREIKIFIRKIKISFHHCTNVFCNKEQIL